MLIRNECPEFGTALEPADAALLSPQSASEVERMLRHRQVHAPTPLVGLAGLACEFGIGSLHVKDEGQRLGLGSFKALGGSYAVACLVLEDAARQLGRPLSIADIALADVREAAGKLTVACATDGNHGRSVAQGAQMVGAKAAIFVHEGVSDGRIEAIARYGARMIRVAGTYDDSVAEASRVAAAEGWMIVSDTSWPGYERVPGLVMQGYTAMVAEALRELSVPPTHLFLQAGVGGFAAAVAAHLTVALGASRPKIVVVEPERAACLFASARAGRVVKVEHGEATVMAMLECYQPSLIAWRILARIADAFMTLPEDAAVDAMRQLANPLAGDRAIVAGESGGAGLAGLKLAASDGSIRSAIGLGPESRVLVFNTEGATDPALYERLVGRAPEEVVGTPAPTA